ncbi:MAG: beta-lactamase family protein [Ruminococcus sp.]|nr:beta-lactamase family protein [Ruminococcus sp.]
MRLIQKLSAAVCAACLTLSAMAVPFVHAEDAQSSVMLPSGLPLDEFRLILEEKEEELEGQFSSAAVGVFQGDEILYTGYFGETNLTEQIPADENSVYEWGSISKTFVWVSTLQLWEQGKLDLSEDIRNYLPDNFFRHLSYDDPITMLHLMNHTAGWCENTYSIASTKADDVRPLRQALQESEPAQMHRPGEVTSYSNWGAALAGYIVECVSGMDYCDYVHENILKPLGMEHTAINPLHSDNSWVQAQREKTNAYMFAALGIKSDLGTCIDYIECYPAGAVTGTLSDLMTYAQAFVDADAPLFQDPKTQEMLFSGSAFYGQSEIPAACYGFWPLEYSVRVYGHSGATNACNADMIFDPQTGFGMAVLVNEPKGNWYMKNASALTFGALSDAKYAPTGNAETITPQGYYLPSRSIYRGLMKFMGYLNGTKLDDIGEIERIGEGVCQITAEGSAMIIGETAYPNGRSGFSVSSMDYIEDDLYLGKLILFTVYVLLAVIASYFLRIQWKLRRAKRWTSYKGCAMMTAGEIAKLVSILALITACVFYSLSYGMHRGEAIAIGIVQMVCIAVCIAAAVSSTIFMLSKKNAKPAMIRYALDTAGNALAVFAMVYFEMYRFWGC